MKNLEELIRKAMGGKIPRYLLDKLAPQIAEVLHGEGVRVPEGENEC